MSIFFYSPLKVVSQEFYLDGSKEIYPAVHTMFINESTCSRLFIRVTDEIIAETTLFPKIRREIMQKDMREPTH
jgi:hypothetical protein